MREFCMVERYGVNDVSYYWVLMEDADRDAIDEILLKYATKGFSCRGAVDAIMDEMKELLGDRRG